MKSVKLNIYLIRHAEKDLTGQHLSSRGKQQVTFLTKRLKNLRLTKIYCSDLERCKETILPLTTKKDYSTFFTPLLREVEGEVKEQKEKHQQKIKPLQQFTKKILQEKGNILIVGSGNVNRILLSFFLKILPQQARFIQTPTGLNHIEQLKNKTLRIVCINDTSHLPQKLNKRQT